MIDIDNFPNQFQRILKIIKPSGGFLVGGAVRDLLLGNEIHDLDFSLPESTIEYAKEVADNLKGDYYLLDKERQTARVILKDQDQKRLIVDFTLFQGNSIEDDLTSRDFTITSMAMDINQEFQLIDLFQGSQDLRDGSIRCTTTHSLKDDPLRCIRAVRMAAQLGFRILPETKKLIHRAKEKLSDISPERIRDEIFRILEGPKQSSALLTLQILDIYPLIFEEDLSDIQGKAQRKLEELWRMMLEDHNQDSAANWVDGLYAHRLGRYREQIRTHLMIEPVPGRSLYQLSFLLPIIMGSGEFLDVNWRDNTLDLTAINKLSLSNQEYDRLEKGALAAVNFLQLAGKGVRILPIDIYRFFRDYKNAGVEGIFLALAHFLIIEGTSLKESSWQHQLEIARNLLEGWWEKRSEWIYPPGLLDGDDLQEELCMEPGPEIGKTLETLREAQVRFGLNSKQEALDYIKNLRD